MAWINGQWVDDDELQGMLYSGVRPTLGGSSILPFYDRPSFTSEDAVAFGPQGVGGFKYSRPSPLPVLPTLPGGYISPSDYGKNKALEGFYMTPGALSPGPKSISLLDSIVPTATASTGSFTGMPSVFTGDEVPVAGPYTGSAAYPTRTDALANAQSIYDASSGSIDDELDQIDAWKEVTPGYSLGGTLKYTDVVDEAQPWNYTDFSSPLLVGPEGAAPDYSQMAQDWGDPTIMSPTASGLQMIDTTPEVAIPSVNVSTGVGPIIGGEDIQATDFGAGTGFSTGGQGGFTGGAQMFDMAADPTWAGDFGEKTTVSLPGLLGAASAAIPAGKFAVPIAKSIPALSKAVGKVFGKSKKTESFAQIKDKLMDDLAKDLGYTSVDAMNKATKAMGTPDWSGKVTRSSFAQPKGYVSPKDTLHSLTPFAFMDPGEINAALEARTEQEEISLAHDLEDMAVGDYTTDPYDESVADVGGFIKELLGSVDKARTIGGGKVGVSGKVNAPVVTFTVPTKTKSVVTAGPVEKIPGPPDIRAMAAAKAKKQADEQAMLARAAQRLQDEQEAARQRQATIDNIAALARQEEATVRKAKQIFASRAWQEGGNVTREEQAVIDRYNDMQTRQQSGPRGQVGREERSPLGSIDVSDRQSGPF